jgi:hypothetical protein
MEINMIDAIKTFFAGLAVLVVASLIIVQPRYIGYGCKNADVPLFAKYESEFPACERIEPIF